MLMGLPADCFVEAKMAIGSLPHLAGRCMFLVKMPGHVCPQPWGSRQHPTSKQPLSVGLTATIYVEHARIKLVSEETLVLSIRRRRLHTQPMAKAAILGMAKSIEIQQGALSLVDTLCARSRIMTAMRAVQLMRLLTPLLTLPRPRVALLQQQRLTTAALKLHAHSAAVSLPKHLDCQHFEQCSGCTVEQVDRPPILEDARAFAAKLGVQDFHFDVGAPHGWRCRARLAVRGRRGDPVIGLYRAGTHDAIDVPHCR